MFLTRNLKQLYEFIVIPRFTSQLVPEKGDVNRMTAQIEIRGNKKFDDVNQNNVNRGNVNLRRICFNKNFSSISIIQIPKVIAIAKRNILKTMHL